MHMREKLRGIIIYAPEDVNKNRKFIELCGQNLREADIELQTVVLNDKDQEDIMESFKTAEQENKESQLRGISFAINRSRNYIVARQLEDMGISVINNSKVTEICNDKWKTYLYAVNRGIPVMETEDGKSDKAASNVGYPMVIKSCGGHGGNEVFLAENEEQKKEIVDKIRGEYIIQRLADTRGEDIRVYVIGGEIVLAMKRSAADGFKSNFSLGGTATEYCLNEAEKDIVRSVVEDLKPDYAGIDLIYDGDRPVLNEIEDAVGARMVYENTDIDIVSMYAKYIAGKL